MVGICRLCASFKPLKELRSLDECEQSFLDTIEHCCRIRLTLGADDGRPKKICVDCTETFKKIEEATAKVQSSQQLLELFFTQNANAENGKGKRKLSLAMLEETFSMDATAPSTPRDPINKKIKMEVTPVPFGLLQAIENHIGTGADAESDSADLDARAGARKVARRSSADCRKQIEIKTTPTWNLVPACCLKCDSRIVGADKLRNHECNGKLSKDESIIRCGYCSKTCKDFRYYMMHVYFHLPHLKQR